MAKLAEKGKISCIFLADAYGGISPSPLADPSNWQESL